MLRFSGVRIILTPQAEARFPNWKHTPIKVSVAVPISWSGERKLPRAVELRHMAGTHEVTR